MAFSARIESGSDGKPTPASLLAMEFLEGTGKKRRPGHLSIKALPW
jgi:hypothetical protein